MSRPSRHVCALACALAIVGALGCGPRRVRWQPTTDPGAAIASAYSIVWRGAPLHLAAERGAPTVSLLDAGSREPWASTAFAPFRIVGEDEGWVELETLGGPAVGHCASGVEAIAPFRLRFFVPREALMPVTAREITTRFEDGTSIALSRGVPLERLGARDMWRAHLGEVRAIVQIRATDIGTRYLPSAPIDRPVATTYLSSDALAAGVPILGVTGRVEGDRGAAQPVYATHERGASELLVELRPTCARIEARVPVHVVGPVDLLVGGRDEEPSSPPFVEPGTAIYWADGSRAGTVASRASPGAELEARGPRRCFSRALRPVPEGSDDPSASLELCFDRRDVVDPDAGIARALDDPS